MTTAGTMPTRGNNGMTVKNVQILEEARFRLKEITGQQQELAETREEILVGRENLVRKGKHIQLQRDRTANAEVAFMNALREHYNNSGASFPTEVDAAYSKVDAERTQLGLLETEHLEFEEDLGAQEWTFMEQENDLYQYELQRIFSTEPASNETEGTIAGELPSIKRSELMLPSASVQYQVARVEHGRLIDRFKTMRKLVADIIDADTLSVDEAELLDLGTSEFSASFSELLSRIAACEARIQHLQAGKDYRDGTSSHQASCTSEPLPVTRKLATPFDTVSQVCSDTALPNSNDQIPVIHRIREWLLDCLNQSSLEKAQYLSILQYTLGYLDNIEFKFPDWEILAAQAWSRDDDTDLKEEAQPLSFSAQETNWDIDAHREAIKDSPTQDLKDALTQGDRAILPILNIVYSPPEWSADLKCFYVLGLAADGNVAEVFWSKDHHVERNERKSSDGTANDLLYDLPISCPWLDFWRNHMGYLDSKYCCVSDLEQPQFFVSGRVFSTMRRCFVEKDGSLSNLMGLRNRSGPLAQYEQHWFQFCFVVIQNKGTFSRCLSVQSSMHHASRRPPTGDWGIIHTSEDPPSPYPWETLSKAPLRVNSINEESLPAFSRVNYSETFSVEHRFPILEVGLALTQELDRLSFHYTLSSDPNGFSRLDETPCNISEDL